MTTMVVLVVKFLGKIISVNIIRDIKESYLVPKNPKPLGMGVSVTNAQNTANNFCFPFSQFSKNSL